MAKSEGFKRLLKHRAEDLVNQDNVHSFLEQKIKDKSLIISEQTSYDRGLIGDLFHYGDLDYMYNLWTSQPWKYSNDGLVNLYSNTMFFHSGDINMLRTKLLFLQVETLDWVTVTDCWNHQIKSPVNIGSNYWGKGKYTYYGGT